MPAFPHALLKKWFLQNRRDMPWREDPTPYKVWISEVMLQQTRVAVVMEYFERWMEKFPDIESLAKARVEDILKTWEGLGYYQRARHLHLAAQMIMERFGGKLPSVKEDLATIQGFGPYTIGAVLSFAFHQKAPAVDGNVLRVLSRYYAIGEEVGPGLQKIVWEHTDRLLPDEEPWVIMEGLIELGAMVCNKRPLCSQCPLKEGCLSFKEGDPSSFPKRKKKELTRIFRHVAVILSGNEVLVCKRPKGEIMADLYEFPYFAISGKEDKEGAAEGYRKKWKLEHVVELREISQHFTRFKARLFPSVYKTQDKMVRRFMQHSSWISLEEIGKLPFSSGHRKIVEQLQVGNEDFTY